MSSCGAASGASMGSRGKGIKRKTFGEEDIEDFRNERRKLKEIDVNRASNVFLQVQDGHLGFLIFFKLEDPNTIDLVVGTVPITITRSLLKDFVYKKVLRSNEAIRRPPEDLPDRLKDNRKCQLVLKAIAFAIENLLPHTCEKPEPEELSEEELSWLEPVRKEIIYPAVIQRMTNKVGKNLIHLLLTTLLEPLNRASFDHRVVSSTTGFDVRMSICGMSMSLKRHQPNKEGLNITNYLPIDIDTDKLQESESMAQFGNQKNSSRMADGYVFDKNWDKIEILVEVGDYGANPAVKMAQLEEYMLLCLKCTQKQILGLLVLPWDAYLLCNYVDPEDSSQICRWRSEPFPLRDAKRVAIMLNWMIKLLGQ